MISMWFYEWKDGSFRYIGDDVFFSFLVQTFQKSPFFAEIVSNHAHYQ